MSSSYIDLLNEITQNLMIIIGIIMFVFGFLGNCMSILTFSSIVKIRFFPPSPSRLYLLITAIADLVFVTYLLLTRILITGFFIPITNENIFMCKSRFYLGQVSQLISVFSISFAAIDQYCLTSRSVRIRRLSQYSFAKVISFFFISLWILVNLPVLFLYKLYPIAMNSSTTICTVHSAGWIFYYTYIQTLIFLCLLPLSLMIIFGFLTKQNIHLMHKRHESISRQLTRMILLQLIVMSLTLGVTTIQVLYQTITINIQQTNLRTAQEGLFNAIANLISYVSYSSGFYIYLYSSKTLRENFKKLLFNFKKNQTVPIATLQKQSQQTNNRVN